MEFKSGLFLCVSRVVFLIFGFCKSTLLISWISDHSVSLHSIGGRPVLASRTSAERCPGYRHWHGDESLIRWSEVKNWLLKIFGLVRTLSQKKRKQAFYLSSTCFDGSHSLSFFLSLFLSLLFIHSPFLLSQWKHRGSQAPMESGRHTVSFRKVSQSSWFDQVMWESFSLSASLCNLSQTLGSSVPICNTRNEGSREETQALCSH